MKWRGAYIFSSFYVTDLFTLNMNATRMTRNIFTLEMGIRKQDSKGDTYCADRFDDKK